MLYVGLDFKLIMFSKSFSVNIFELKDYYEFIGKNSTIDDVFNLPRRVNKSLCFCIIYVNLKSHIASIINCRIVSKLHQLVCVEMKRTEFRVLMKENISQKIDETLHEVYSSQMRQR